MVSLIKILILGCVTGFISALPTNILISEDIVSNKYPYSNRNIYLSIGALLSNIFLLLFFNTTITFLFNINKYIINYIFILLGIAINFFIFNYFTNKEFSHKETSKSNIKYLNAFMSSIVRTTTNKFTIFIWFAGSIIYNYIRKYISMNYIIIYYTGLICGISIWFIFLNILQIKNVHIITPTSITNIKNILLKFFFIISLLLIMLGVYNLMIS